MSGHRDVVEAVSRNRIQISRIIPVRAGHRGLLTERGAGSSPLARGTRALRPSSSREVRIIPLARGYAADVPAPTSIESGHG
jgi:hypothetical protein